MNGQDLFVGIVAGSLGALAIIAALFNWEWCYQLRKAQWIESRFGRAGARVAIGAIGVLLIILGLAIASGIRWYGRQTQGRRPVGEMSAAC